MSGDHDGMRFLVLEVEGKRIERLQVELFEPPPSEQSEEPRAAEG